MKKHMITLVMAIMTVGSIFAQSDKMKEEAQKKVDELNEQIVSGDPTLALTEEQQGKLYDLYITMFKDIKTEKKDGGGKEDIKEARKAVNKKIFGEILTKEQRKARKKGKEE
ncbi:MAG: hypothetical protein CL868_16585 [Cytophagaceae bacterium]|nr:hypothetical protein [Cytophagaceae bacterium]|tara:strand:- start:6404 stop:6739 length:336 start_codon:yes stop_codon:yes gene_type:complete